MVREGGRGWTLCVSPPKDLPLFLIWIEAFIRLLFFIHAEGLPL